MNNRRTDHKTSRKRTKPAPLPEEDRVDTSDIGPLGPDFFASAARNPFYKPRKQSMTVRVDADVVAWLKASGPGYQTRLNVILRTAMLRDVASPRARAGSSSR